MPSATLIINPASGHAQRLAAQLPAIIAQLASHGYTTELLSTTSEPDSAHELAARAAISSSLIFACGGDGTVHGVIQGLAHTAATFGVLPLGTANALARNLALPLDPLAALARVLTYPSQSIPLGEITTSTHTRLFIIMAGCGPDGALVHGLSQAVAHKSRFGRQAYYFHAARLFFTRRWSVFEARYRIPGSDVWHTERAFAVSASRIPDLGGLFSGLTPRASLLHPHLHVQLLRPPAQLAMAAWFASSRTHLPNPWVTTLDVVELCCTPLNSAPVYTQADAEPLGTLPFSLRIVPGALKLLMPPGTGDRFAVKMST